MNGMETLITIRSIEERDAAGFICMRWQLDQESVLLPGGKMLSLAEQRIRIRRMRQSDNQAMFVAEDRALETLVGYIGCWGGQHEQSSRTARVTVAVLRQYQGKGIASRLFAALWEWARCTELARFELTTMVDNIAAIGIYQSEGFQTEGVRKGAVWTGSELADELYMAAFR